MKLSIVILCWNGRKVISDCLRSIIAGTHCIDYEIVVSDNGSTDGSVEFIRRKYPTVRVIENGRNLGFGKGNNVGIRACVGELILLLNQDTIVHNGALDRWVEFSDRHPEAGAFGCRILNPDGSYQGCARPFPTVWREWIAALYLRPLAYISNAFVSDTYVRWKGETERLIDWQAGCCLMVRADLLKRLGGFDERFYFYYEDVDLCRRIWEAGCPIIYTPEVIVTHLGGQSTKRAPRAFEVDRYRNQYRYFYKYHGTRGVRRCRRVSLGWLMIRYLGYSLLQLANRNGRWKQRLSVYRAAIEWNRRVDAVRFVEEGDDPAVVLGERC